MNLWALFLNALRDIVGEIKHLISYDIGPRRRGIYFYPINEANQLTYENILYLFHTSSHLFSDIYYMTTVDRW